MRHSRGTIWRGGSDLARRPRVRHLLCMAPRDILALFAAAVVTAGLAAITILPGVYPARVPLGYILGTVEAYEFTASKYGGARGILDIHLDRGESIRLQDTGGYGPGDRVCVRATMRGNLIEGYLIGLRNCPEG